MFRTKSMAGVPPTLGVFTVSGLLALLGFWMVNAHDPVRVAWYGTEVKYSFGRAGDSM